MKCFLHIGTEKTATTTIQAFFHANRGKLLNHGFIYTKSAGITNNRLLSVAAYDLNRRDIITSSHQVNSQETMLACQRQIVSKLKKEIERVRKDSSSIIFSSEHFQSRLTRMTEIRRLKRILDNLGATDVSVIVYLRRPADIACSLYSTAVKCGNYSLQEPPPPGDRYFNNVCNHKNTLLKYAAIFGEEAVTPRLFAKSEFVNESIIADISQLIGIPEDDAYVKPGNRNESISLLGIKLLQRLNKSIPVFVQNKPNPLRANLMSYVEKNFSDSKYVMPSRLYADYDREFQESNDWVRDRYFPGRSSLFSSHIPEDVSLDVSEPDLDAIATCIASIWIDQQKRIIDLSQ